MSDTRKHYLYSDGIYVNMANSDYSYLKKVKDVDLNDVEELKPFLENGDPSDNFSFAIESNENVKKLPWQVTKKVINTAYTILSDNDIKEGDILYLYVFQHLNADAENNDQRFSVYVPHQKIGDKETYLDDEDEELQRYFDDADTITVGQFIFVKRDENSTTTKDDKREVAIQDFETRPQFIYLFNNFNTKFTFAEDFGLAKTVVSDTNGNLNIEFVKPAQAKLVAELPIIEDKTANSAKSEIDEDFNVEPSYVYRNQTMKIYHLLGPSEINSFDSVKILNEAERKAAKDEYVEDTKETIVDDDFNDDFVSDETEQGSFDFDAINNASTESKQEPAKTKQEVETPQQAKEPVAETDDDLEIVDDEDLLTIEDDIEPEVETHQQEQPEKDIKDMSKEELIDTLPPDKRLIETDEGAPVFYAQTNEQEEPKDENYQPALDRLMNDEE